MTHVVEAALPAVGHAPREHALRRVLDAREALLVGWLVGWVGAMYTGRNTKTMIQSPSKRNASPSAFCLLTGRL